MVIICYEAEMAWRIFIVWCLLYEWWENKLFTLFSCHSYCCFGNNRKIFSIFLSLCCLLCVCIWIDAAWKYYFFTLLLFILISVIFNLIAWSKTISQLVLVIFTIFLCRLILVMFLLLLLMSVQIEKLKKKRRKEKYVMAILENLCFLWKKKNWKLNF